MTTTTLLTGEKLIIKGWKSSLNGNSVWEGWGEEDRSYYSQLKNYLKNRGWVRLGDTNHPAWGRWQIPKKDLLVKVISKGNAYVPGKYQVSYSSDIFE